MIRAVLIDDERNSLETLRMELELNCPDIEVVATSLGPEAGQAAIAQHKPDLVFLDIQMPGMNGFELLQSMDHVSFDVIFVTAFDTYSMQAIKVSAMDYLLKPVDGEELKKAVEKVRANQELRQSKERVDFLLTNLQAGTTGFSKIALPTLKGLDFVNVEDILFCEADGNYTTIHTDQGESYVISRTLSEFEEMLSNSMFFRTHKSYLINLQHIKQYIKGSGGQIIMKNGTSVQVARARKELLMERIFPRS
ncbi:MAG: LytTR family DNA-binding domain-containing protein [Saprospiraceae bacterium]|nr:LytTR family DNA-binding domain-containing protein [Saprospiraceae bacterium]